MQDKMTVFSVLFCGAVPLAFAQDSNTSIEELLVIGKEFSSQSQAGSRLELGVREIPATIDVIDGDIIRNRLDLSLLEAVTRSAGFTGAGNPGNGGTSIAARGFTGQDAVTKLYDGNHFFTLAGTITFPFDTWAIERVEILKGPASVLYGQGGVAGAFNVIPKSSSEEFDLDARLSVGEDSTRFFGIGVTGALTEVLTARVDYSKSESDNWVNNGASDSEMIALETTWRATEDLSITLRLDSGEQSPLRYFGIPVVDGEFPDTWTDLNLNVGDSRIHYDDDMVRLISDWNISDTVSFNGELFSLNTDRFWQTVETYSYDAPTRMIQRWDPLIIRQELEQKGVRGNFVFNLNLGEMRWKTSIGFETTAASMDYTSNFNPSHPNSVDWGADFDVVNPDNFVAGSWSDVSSSVAALDQVSEVDQWALFAEMQLRMTKRLALVGGLRYDEIDTDYERLTYASTGVRDTGADNRINQKINPSMARVGFVYDINPSTSVYGQYSTGETHPRGGDIVRVSNNLKKADTVSVRQLEVGLKQSLTDDRLHWNLAWFDINKQNMRIDDPNNPDPTIFTIVPEQKSRGVEVGVEFLVSSNFLTYANASVLESERDTGTEYVPTDYVPEMTVNAGLLYSLTASIRFGADYRYVDERPFGNTPLDSFSVVDLSLGWIVNERVRFTLNAENILDELYATSDHWTGGQWSVGQPRTLSITADFNL